VISFLALLLCCAGILWLLSRDAARRPDVSPAAWVALIWVTLYASRPLTSWFGDPTALTTAEAHDQGNTEEALINLVLILAAAFVLARRRLRISSVISANPWLTLVYFFWLQSVLWSDEPIITAKRLFKELGNLAMVLVILTDKNPASTMRAVCVRCAYIALPLSAVVIRYYPDYGRGYVGWHMDEMMLLGITGHKNALGILACVGVIFLLWDLIERRGRGRADAAHWAATVVVLMIGWYFLLVADSATALVCAVMGSALLLAAGLPSLARHPSRIEVAGVCALVTVWTINNWFHIDKAFIENLGRNMTLTTRTDMWPVLLRLQDQPLLGAGFSTFWSGWRLVQTQQTFGHLFLQAHNGYLETYLNGGLIGVGLLIVLLAVAYTRIRQRLAEGTSDAGIRFTMLLVAIVHNFTEATFYKLSLLWFVTVFAFMDYHAPEAAGPKAT
jgi:exopolysaccharide production protein ExoQ